MMHEVLTEFAAHETVSSLIAGNDLAWGFVQRLAGGETADEAMLMVHDLADSGRFVALERSWSPDADLDEAVRDYELMITLLGASGLGPIADVVVPSALLSVPRGPEALDELCAEAMDARTTIMVATAQADEVDDCLAAVRRQQAIGRQVGVVLQASLRRTELDCTEVVGRVRLVKSGVDVREPARFSHDIEVDKSYVRCAKALLQRPEVTASFATHDGRLVGIVESLGQRYGRVAGELEFAMYLGRARAIQQRLIDAGEDVRVYVPFGADWLGRLIGGLAERPRGLGAGLRSLLPGQ